MAQNITLLGASYPGVPAVVLPRTGGGNAAFYDTSGASLSSSDGAKILTGESAVGSDGRLIAGTMPDYAAAQLLCRTVALGSTMLSANSYSLPLPAADLGGRPIRYLRVYSGGSGAMKIETTNTTGNYITGRYLIDVSYSEAGLFHDGRKYVCHTYLVDKKGNVASAYVYVYSATSDGYHFSITNPGQLVSGGAVLEANTAHDDVGRFRTGVTYQVMIGG